MAFNLFDTPDYYTGLLGEEATQKLQNKALGTGLVNAALAFIAQPRNQRYGSALPYLGKALMGGYQAGQDVIQGGLRDYETQQKIKQLQAQREAVAKVSAENPELGRMLEAYPTAAPGVLEKLYSPREAKPVGQLLTQQEAAAQGLPTDQGQRWQRKPDQTFEIVSGTAPSKEAGLTNDRDAVAFEKYRKPFNQLTQNEAGIVNKAVAELSASKAPKVSVNLADPTAKAKVALDLSERASKFYQADIDTANQYNIIKSLAKNPTPTGDTTLLYSLFKVLDPTSTVREGEVNMVMNSRSIPAQLKGYAQKLAGGGVLLPKERNEILQIAEQRVNIRKSNVEKTRKAFVENAKRFDLDPDIYVPNPYAEQAKGNVQVDY